MIYKCKMCGGNIEFEKGNSVGKCDSCGTRQTLPNIDSDKREKLYERANSLRRGNDFDRALEIYSQILDDKPDDAEAYWSVLLCMYGIEYVEDPYSHKRVPTVNRTQFTSIYNNENYKMALKYATDEQKVIYKEEADKINDIQKEILAITQKAEPFDVFICYKETDNNGRRTLDSVLATDLYDQLSQAGFKVFFSRITLQDIIGTAYEPYIFAALKSSKVMIVLGTKPEYFNAVWVRNEWSRFLGFVSVSGGKKILIPAYKDMDPYDLPKEFAHLQAQNMSSIGFVQDLIRGIKKYVHIEDDKSKDNLKNGYDYGYEQERGRLQAQEDFRKEQQRREEQARLKEEAAKQEEERKIEAAKKRAEEEKRLKIEKNEHGRKRYHGWVAAQGVIFFVGLLFCIAEGTRGGGVFLIFISLIGLGVLGLMKGFFYKESIGKSNAKDGPVLLRFPSGFEPFQECDYMDLADELRSMGFTNISYRNMHDIIIGWFTKPGRINKVYVQGNEIDSGGKKYPADIPILIEYHGK